MSPKSIHSTGNYPATALQPGGGGTVGEMRPLSHLLLWATLHRGLHGFWLQDQRWEPDKVPSDAEGAVRGHGEQARNLLSQWSGVPGLHGADEPQRRWHSEVSGLIKRWSLCRICRPAVDIVSVIHCEAIHDFAVVTSLVVWQELWIVSVVHCEAIHDFAVVTSLVLWQELWISFWMCKSLPGCFKLYSCLRLWKHF